MEIYTSESEKWSSKVAKEKKKQTLIVTHGQYS